MANNYSYSYQSEPALSQPLVDSDSNPPKENKSLLKALIFAGLFILVASIIIICVILFRKEPIEITSPIKFENSETVSGLSLVSEYQFDINVSSFSSNGKYFAYPTKSATVKVLEVESQTLIAEFKNKALNDIVVGISFTQNDKELVIATEFGFVQVWELETKSLKYIKMIEGRISKYQVTKDSKHAVLDRIDTLSILNIDDGSIDEFSYHANRFIIWDLSPDNKYLWEYRSRIWDFNTRVLIFDLGPKFYTDAYFTHDSRHLVALLDDFISIWNLETRKEVVKISHNDEIKTLKISQNNKYIVVGTDDGVKVYELETGAVAGYYLSGYSVDSLSISAENRYIFASGEDSHLELINLETNTSKTGFEINEPLELNFQSFGANQKYLTGIDRENKFYLWKVLN